MQRHELGSLFETAERSRFFRPSAQMKRPHLLQPLHHRDAEGAPLLTAAAGDAVLRPGAEGLVVGPDGLGHLGLHHRRS